MKLIDKLVKADGHRQSRLHTEEGDFCGISALQGAIPAGLTWLRAHFTGRYVPKPWWVWDAIKFVEANLRSTDRILEVGSGYSTIWLAQRCKYVWSIEESSSWREIVKREIKRFELGNVNIITSDSFNAFQQLFPQNEWDVVVIDSPQDRRKIFRLALKGVRLPRIIIYDDTDKTENKGVMSSRPTMYQIRTFRGFKPQTIHVCETTVFIQIATGRNNAFP